MKGGVYLDPEAPQLVQRHFALVRARRGRRQRFPEGVVEVVGSEQEARARQDPAQDLHAAEVVGPSRSSEGFRLYYLVRWLDP
ncbi:MAG: hypothetical protein NZL99_01700 [Burkholderiaceae bacterium]|nr:hypothetical protein [Burkholderiaceae bacterium]MCX8004713.1 hypothetical protein [Burkholderiaceae bacterium]